MSSPSVTAAPFALFKSGEHKKLAVLMLAMCGLAHLRRKEMQKRWLSAKQTPGLFDHPAVAYLLENGALFLVPYILLKYFPKPIQERPLFTAGAGLIAAIGMVEPLILFEKFMAVYLYPHVPYFSERSVPHDAWTMFTDYLQCNIPAMGVGSLVLGWIMLRMPKPAFERNIINPKPLELLPYLAKYAFCRVVVDIVFGVAHRAMHEYPAFYKAVHKRHHEHQTPRSPTNFHFTALDIFLESFFPVQVSILVLGALGYAPNNIEQFCLTTSLIYYESASHTGKEIPTVTWFPLLSPLVDMITGCDQRLIEYHTRHHQLYRCNYSISPWVDRLWGTYRIDLPEHYNSGKAEEVQTE